MFNQNTLAIQLDLNNVGVHLKSQLKDDKGIFSMSGSTDANTQSEEKESEKRKSRQNDDGGNNKKSMESKSNKSQIRLPQFYGFVLRRIVATTQYYLDETPDNQALVDENSRFYYVKQILDNLKMKERKSFRVYLDNIRQQKYHKPITEEELAEKKSKGIRRFSDKPILSKKFVEEFLSGKHGDILIKLNEEFLKPGNRDFELYMDSELDEVKIGKVVKVNKLHRKKTWNTMQKNMDHYKDMYALLVEAVKVKQMILSRKKKKGVNKEENKEEDTQP